MLPIDAINLLRDTCARQHLSIHTEKAYLHWLRRYIGFLQHSNPTPPETSEEKIEAFLTNLALEGVAASTQNQAFNAVLFFYRYILKQELHKIDALRAKRPPALRHCPEREEVSSLLTHVADVYRYPTRLIVHLIYGCGLRVCEPLNLRIKDLDLGRRRLHIHQAKGNKGRVVSFPECLASALEHQLLNAKALAAQDLQNNIPVALPGLLAKKFPSTPAYKHTSLKRGFNRSALMQLLRSSGGFAVEAPGWLPWAEGGTPFKKGAPLHRF